MKRLDILAAFEVEIDKIDDALNKPVTDDSLYWLNQAVNKFMKERFNGNAPHYTSYEQNEKRTKDLHRLFKKVHIPETQMPPMNYVLNPAVLSAYPNMYSFDGFVENVTLAQVGTTEEPTGIYFDTVRKCFVVTIAPSMLIGGSTTYYNYWSSDNSEYYITPSQDYVYLYDNVLYKINENNQLVQMDMEQVYDLIPEELQELMHYLGPFMYNTRNQFDAQAFVWPLDLLYILNEDVAIADTGNKHFYDTCVFECTADNFMYRVTNSLTDFHYKYHKARPLRVRCGENESGVLFIVLLNDKKYHVEDYYISYLRRPEKLTNEDPDNANVEYNDFEDSVWFEIIKIAAQMYVENKAEPRYRTLTNEVLTQE